jgi:ketosteroid isomerase-like protein
MAWQPVFAEIDRTIDARSDRQFLAWGTSTGHPLCEEHIMSATTTTTDVDAVRAGFAAVAAGDMAGFAAMFHPDATWNHRNDDRLGGVKEGVDAIVGFLGESMELTAGTLRPVPEVYMPDGHGHVAVLTQISATRPDGRDFMDTQILLFTLEQGRVSVVDQFVGDPPAVTHFWA